MKTYDESPIKLNNEVCETQPTVKIPKKGVERVKSRFSSLIN